MPSGESTLEESCFGIVEADHAPMICASHVLGQVLHDNPSPSPADDDELTISHHPDEDIV